MVGQRKGVLSMVIGNEVRSRSSVLLAFWLAWEWENGHVNLIINQLRERNQVVQSHFISEAHRVKRTISYGLRSIATQLALSDERFYRELMAMHLETGLSFCDKGQNFHSIWQKIFEGIAFRFRFRQPWYWFSMGSTRPMRQISCWQTCPKSSLKHR